MGDGGTVIGNNTIAAVGDRGLLALTPARLWEAEHGLGPSPVSAWASRVGGASATQGTGANQPAAPAACSRLRNRLALPFDGTDRLLDSADLDCSAAWSALRVFDLDALKNEHGVLRLAAAEITGGGGVCCYATSAGHLVVGSADTSWYTIAYNSVAANTAYAILISCGGAFASLVVEVGTISGGSITWSNRSLTAISGTFAMPAAVSQRVVLGGGWSSSGSLLSGRSAVEAWWTRVLSADDKAAAKAWVARNYT